MSLIQFFSTLIHDCYWQFVLAHFARAPIMPRRTRSPQVIASYRWITCTFLQATKMMWRNGCSRRSAAAAHPVRHNERARTNININANTTRLEFYLIAEIIYCTQIPSRISGRRFFSVHGQTRFLSMKLNGNVRSVLCTPRDVTRRYRTIINVWTGRQTGFTFGAFLDGSAKTPCNHLIQRFPSHPPPFPTSPQSVQVVPFETKRI